ncbi:MAG: hypothetical protein ACR2MG_17480 [Pyrinomonadaceae bacterium]
MLIAVEAEIDTNGIVTLLEPVTVTRKTRAVVTLLDAAEPAAKPELSEEEKQRREANFARHFGAVKSGDSRSADNDKIDADLAREYGRGL